MGGRRLTFRRLFGLDRSGPAAAADAGRQPAAPVDDPERDRLRAPGADPGVPVVALSSADGTDALAGDAVRGDRLGRLRRRDRGARDAPVQPPRRADGPGHRPPAGRLRASSSAGTSSCCRAGRSPCSRRASCDARARRATALQRGVELRINWPGRLAVAPVMGSFFFAMVGLGTLGEVLLYVGLALALRRDARCTVARRALRASSRRTARLHSLKLSLTFGLYCALRRCARRTSARRPGASRERR